jgi:hypothetical protein
MILKRFSLKVAFLTHEKAKLRKNLIVTLVFEKNANLFREKCRNLQKIVTQNAALVEKNDNSFVFVFNNFWRQRQLVVVTKFRVARCFLGTIYMNG